MSESDDLDDLRERKIEELRERVEGDEGAGAPDEPVHVGGAAEYDELLAEHGVVLVDFYADWCGPCKMLEPTVEQLAAETDAAVLKVDVDAHGDLAGRMNVQGVPTLVLYADGEPVERVVGVKEKGQLRTLIDRYA